MDKKSTKFKKKLKAFLKSIILLILIIVIVYPILFLSPLSSYVDDLVIDVYGRFNQLKYGKVETYEYGDIEIQDELKEADVNIISNDIENSNDIKEDDIKNTVNELEDYTALKEDYINAQYRRDLEALSDDNRELLEYIVFEISSFKSRIDIPSGYKIDTDDLSKIVSIIRMNYPELFMINLNYNYETIGNRVVSYSPDYKMNKNEYEESLKNVNLEVFKIIQMVDSLTPYEQLLYIHNYLLKNSEYTSSTLNNNNVCGILLEGKGACEGYSSSFMYITNILGFKTSQVFGEELGNTSDLAHSWNLIEYNDQAYYFDLTWDFSSGKVHQTYFGMTYDEMVKKHDITLHNKYLRELPKEPNDGLFSYHKQMNLVAKDMEKFEEIVYSSLKDNRMIQVKFKDSKLYEEGVNNIDMIVEKAVKRLGKIYSKYSILYYKENNTLILFDFVE